LFLEAIRVYATGTQALELACRQEDWDPGVPTASHSQQKEQLEEKNQCQGTGRGAALEAVTFKRKAPLIFEVPIH
jgi:hypothetical protein